MTNPGLDISPATPGMDGYGRLGHRELLEAVGRQDREAFREFYDRFAGRLMAYVQAMGKGRIPAEDVVQEVLVAIWRKAAQYRADLGNPEAWIFTITRNKVFDIWRANSAVIEDGDLNLEAFMDPSPPSDPTLAVSLGKALASLPPEQRDPLILSYFGDHTYEETARRLKVPLGTIKSRIRAGLSQLKQHLGSP